ncbi:MAG: transglutaminase domain-containing protein [Planctomycetota bacterium]
MLRQPRPVRRFAPRIDRSEVLAPPPSPAEVAHWGEYTLLEDIAIVLHRDGTTTWLTHVITMPHSDESLAQWDAVQHSYLQGQARLQALRAAVYTPDSGIHPAQQTRLQLGQQSRMLQLSFSPLRPGVMIEYELQDDQFKPSPTLPGIVTHHLQKCGPPCRRRRLTIAIAEPYTETTQLLIYHEGVQPQRFEQDGYEVVQWDLRDVPGVEIDSWTPPLRDFTPWVDVSTVPDWEPIAEHYRTELLPPSPPPRAIERLANELVIKHGDPATVSTRDKMLAVYEYATRDIRYGRHPSELVTRRVRDTSQMLRDLRGDCKDKSSLMVTLLEALQIPAQVVVVLTANNGSLPFLPSLRFDHAIVRAQLDGEEIWFDPAAGHYSFGDFPQNDQGVVGLVIAQDHWEAITTPWYPPERQRTTRLGKGEILANGDFIFRNQVTAFGERAASFRHQLHERNAAHQHNVIKAGVCEERPGAEVTEVEIGDLDNLEQPVTMAYTVRIRNWARAIRDLLIFRIPWADVVGVHGPISADQRTQPLQLPLVSEMIQSFELKLPPGYSGYGLPLQESWTCEGLSYELRIWEESEMLHCQRQFRLTGRVIAVEEFPAFKQAWENCARSDTRDVVLMRNQTAKDSHS